jgi:pilus assembly protein CpaE
MAAPKILVVDDSPTTVALVSAALEAGGFRPVGATSGEEALGMLESERPDLIVADIIMPGMDGLELCRRVRKSLTRWATPILLLTLKGELADRVAGFEAGADDYMVKPFEPKELQTRVRVLLARREPSVILPTPLKEMGKVVVVFGCKGGVGTTTIAITLAIALRGQGRRVALVDADWSFGDVGLHLNLPPAHTVTDLTPYGDALEPDIVAQAMLSHASGIEVLLSPPRPERAEEVDAPLVQSLLQVLKSRYEFVVVDCQRSYEDRTLVLLDGADRIILVLTADIGALRNASLFLTLARDMGYPKEKIVPVLNGAGFEMGITEGDVRSVLKDYPLYTVESGGVEVATTANQGEAVAMTRPKNKMVRSVRLLAGRLAEEFPPPDAILAEKGDRPKNIWRLGGKKASSESKGEATSVGPEN